MSSKSKILLGLASVLLALSLLGLLATRTRPAPPPAITGVLIPEARPLAEFSLLDHRQGEFNRQSLVGRWHLLSYGYTHCPDICPTTLTVMAQVARMLERDQALTDVQFLFYTIDPGRDTIERLADYVPWFHPDFLGLSADENKPGARLAFERSLGIVSVITPVEQDQGLEDYDSYGVSHGVNLFLLNPEGHLQAVLKPTVDRDGTQYFTVEQIYQDYRAIRGYLG